MKIAAISIADYCEATEGMPHDVERLYFRMILKMLAREGGLPDDDADNARIFGYDRRVYARLKAKLIAWSNAIYVEDGLLKNKRVEDDIKAYQVRRGEAVENGRKGGLAKAEVSRKSEESPAEVCEKSPRISHATNSKNSALAVASPSPSPTPTPKEPISPLAPEKNAAGGLQEIPGLNGSTTLIVTAFAEWMNPWAPDLPGALKSVRDAVGIYGDVAVRDGFADYKADIADNKVRAPSVKALYGYIRRAKEKAPKAAAAAKPAAARPAIKWIAPTPEELRAINA